MSVEISMLSLRGPQNRIKESRANMLNRLRARGLVRDPERPLAWPNALQ